MAQRGTSFTLKYPDQADRMIKYFASVPQKVDKEMQKRMTAAVNMVYTIAHQKRPYITQQQARAEGRKRLPNSKKYHVVSDPSAKLGVPVAQIGGGALQASIQKGVTQRSGKTTGIVYVDDPGYAEHMEFGTSTIEERPFMRPAFMLTKEAISNLFNQKIKFDTNI